MMILLLFFFKKKFKLANLQTHVNNVGSHSSVC